MATIFQRGTRFGPYVIGDLIGAGYVSEVYEATEPGGAVVAIKVLKPDAPPHTKREARLAQEGIALADVEHVNVVRFRGEGVVDGRVYLVMERVHGIDLRQLLAQAGGLLPLERVVRIGYQAAEGLAAVHERGILHRDVKPENILVTLDDLVKIADFGSAWIGGFGVKTTREQHLTSVLYGSPEHMHSRPIVPASDVYVLGLVLYEMAAGIHPMAPSPASALEIWRRQVGFDPPPLITLSSDERPIPKDLSDVVARTLCKDPAGRPSASALAEALRKVLRPLLARHRAGAGGAILGRTEPMKAVSSGGTIPMSVYLEAPARDAIAPPAPSAASTRDAIVPPAPSAASTRDAIVPPAPSAPAAATLRSPVYAPLTIAMSAVDVPAERRSTGAPVERPARVSRSPRGRSIVAACVVLVGGIGAAGWLLLGRDGGTSVGAPPSPMPAAAPPAPATSASTSSAAAAPPETLRPPAPSSALPRPRPAPRRPKPPFP